MPLTATAIRNAKADDKPRKLFDGEGLYLQVMPNGGKRWRLKYRFDGKEKLLSLSVYPDIGLKTARERDNCKNRHDKICFESKKLIILLRRCFLSPRWIFIFCFQWAKEPSQELVVFGMSSSGCLLQVNRYGMSVMSDRLALRSRRCLN